MRQHPGPDIRLRRRRLKWSQRDLAKAAHVNAETVNNIEAGRNNRINSLDKVQTALAREETARGLMSPEPAGVDQTPRLLPPEAPAAAEVLIELAFCILDFVETRYGLTREQIATAGARTPSGAGDSGTTRRSVSS